MAKDEWIRAAMTDDTVVVELLVRLKQSYATPPARPPAVLPPLDWGLRQPRSKLVFRCSAVLTRKDHESTRDSPTTPLSWSGGGSPCATADGGLEEFSRPANCSSAGRSKGTGTNEANTATTGRRSRRKKTFAELKEEESMLLKERIYLRKEIAALRVTVRKERAANESLKKMKLDLDLQSAKQECTTSAGREETFSSQPHQTEASPDIDHTSFSVTATQASCENFPPPDSCGDQKFVETQGSFLLPDLNMMPVEEDLSSGLETTLCGMS
ncbi:uncharacterized protein LOC131152213 [Malania oleifera]|uniref:uncharacterized protein LOC131152213 n=1 Tax=Malania oleifera TaxID=397392 RepID=UPI0025ADD296|nr:uncharacterized protein LOC131152213 [Malania oleifera]